MPSLSLTVAAVVSIGAGWATPRTPPRPGPSDCSYSRAGLQGKHHHQLPLALPSATTTPAPCLSQPVRVAIIGGGPAGTSSSFWVSQFANRSGNPVELHIFERSDYLGGRSNIIHPFDSDLYPPIEAGASIFVPANKHIHQAVRYFNLTLQDQGETGNYAIWDGTEFAFESSGSGWWNTIKLFWRYGRGPYQLNSLSKQTVDQFLAAYTNQFVGRGPFEELNEWTRAIGLTHLLSTTASDYLTKEQSINVQAVNELAAIMARTNYGQDISSMHGLGAMVSIAGSGGTGVKGGNRQIFQKFANHSAAQIHLNHLVTTITQLDLTDHPGRPDLKYVLTYRKVEDKTKTQPLTSTDSVPFDAVILAAPYHQADITLLTSRKPSTQIPSQPFVKLHVTFIVTNSTAPSGQLFGRGENEYMARSIYSTLMRSVLGKGERPFFNSLNYLKNLGPKEGVVGDMHVVKVFSEAPIPTDTLSKLFGSSRNLIWIKRIEWDAYPMLTPLTHPTNYAPTKLGEKLYYVNGFESIISTMETQTLAAQNIAMMLSKEFWNFTPKESWTTNG